jgi:hypothetical protein
VVERSEDFVNWTAIDRKIDNKDLKAADWMRVSFAVLKSTECGFVRLTQTGKNHSGGKSLLTGILEPFGTPSMMIINFPIPVTRPPFLTRITSPPANKL